MVSENLNIFPRFDQSVNVARIIAFHLLHFPRFSQTLSGMMGNPVSCTKFTQYRALLLRDPFFKPVSIPRLPTIAKMRLRA